MGKSIETIWKEGFLKNDALVAPKLNNLYNQKSKLLIEKIKRTTKTDNLSIIPIAIIFLATCSYIDLIFVGIYGMLIMFSLFFLNKKLLISLDEINLNTNNYRYLVAYKKAIEKIITFTTKLLGFGLPLVIIPGYWLFFKETEIYQKLINEASLLFILLIAIGVGLLISIIGILTYKLTTKIVYGNLVTKLDEIIVDMEELRA